MIPSDNPPGIRLCALDALPEEGAAGFEVEIRGSSRAIFVVRHKGACHAYLNSCPHTGVMLDWQPDQFLDSSGTLIQCSTHGALFRIEDGFCIYGPCANRSLNAVPTQIEAGQLYLLP